MKPLLTIITGLAVCLALSACSRPAENDGGSTSADDAPPPEKRAQEAPAESERTRDETLPDERAQSPLRHLGRFEVPDIQIDNDAYVMGALIQGSRYIMLFNFDEQAAHVFRYSNGNPVARIEHTFEPPDRIVGHPSQPRYLLAHKGGIECWSIPDKQRLWTWADGGEAQNPRWQSYHAAFRPRQRDIIVVGPAGGIHILNDDGVEQVSMAALRDEDHPTLVQNISPDGTHMFVSTKGVLIVRLEQDGVAGATRHFADESIEPFDDGWVSPFGAGWVSNKHFAIVRWHKTGDRGFFALEVFEWAAPDQSVFSREDDDIDDDGLLWDSPAGAFSYSGDELVYGFWKRAKIRVVGVPTGAHIGDEDVDADKLFGLIRRPRSNDFVSWGVKDGTVVVDKWRLR